MFGVVCVIIIGIIAMMLLGGREDDWRDMDNEGPM